MGPERLMVAEGAGNPVKGAQLQSLGVQGLFIAHSLGTLLGLRWPNPFGKVALLVDQCVLNVSRVSSHYSDTVLPGGGQDQSWRWCGMAQHSSTGHPVLQGWLDGRSYSFYRSQKTSFCTCSQLIFLLTISDCLFLQRLTLANMWQLILMHVLCKTKKDSCF